MFTKDFWKRTLELVIRGAAVGASSAWVAVQATGVDAGHALLTSTTGYGAIAGAGGAFLLCIGSSFVGNPQQPTIVAPPAVPPTPGPTGS